jgi:hypothetical protein
LEDNIKIYIKEVGYDGVNWIHLAQDMHQWGGGGEMYDKNLVP